MRGVLLIACAGPMQSWGTRSRFQERDTEREPSKSGIIGLLCAALGRDREEPLEDLAALRMGVRADREGVPGLDFQTAENVMTAGGGIAKDPLISNRNFLADACFVAGLEGDPELLSLLHRALRTPRWPLYLGRKSYVPSIPPYLKDGLVSGKDLRSALLEYPLLTTAEEAEVRRKRMSVGRGDCRIRVVLESAVPTHETRRDQPISFALNRREFRERFVVTEYLDIDSFGREGA